MIWQLISAFRGDTSDEAMAALLVQVAARVFVILFCLSVHEFAHAWAARKLGDDTAWMHGRMTINPSKHLDLFGTLMILVVGFGYAKPVPVNPRNFKNHKKGMALTAAAGPLSNLILAVLFCLLSYILLLATRNATGDAARLITLFLFYVSFSNVGLMVFNLIPFPPLDGSRILDLLLPPKASYAIARYEGILRWAVFALLLFSGPISALVRLAFNGLSALAGLPFPFTIKILVDGTVAILQK